MSIELDGVPLIRTVRDPNTGITSLSSSIQNLKVDAKRSIVELKIPGLGGGVLQDLGRESIKIYFEGTLAGEEAKQTLENIRSKFKTGEAIPFHSDISSIAEVTNVLIEDLKVEETGGILNRYDYIITLKEYKLPKEEEETPPSQDEEAEESVEQQANDNLGSINYIIGKVVDDEDNPQSDVSVKISFDGGEYNIKTDEEGIFRKDDLEPGTYLVTIDAEGYRGIEKEIIIKSGSERAEVTEKEAEEEEGEIEEEEEEPTPF